MLKLLISLDPSEIITMNNAVGNAKEFSGATLKCLKGSLPCTINGNYFRNGPGIVNYGNTVSDHWFSGDGSILKLSFSKGECEAQVKFV